MFLLHCTLLTGVVGCGESSGPSGPGQLHITLESSNTDDAAAVLELSGSGLGNVEVLGGEAFLQQEGNTTRVVIVLDDAGKIDFSIDVDDMSQRPTVRILQVADGDNRLRGSVADYETAIQPLAALAESGRGQ